MDIFSKIHVTSITLMLAMAVCLVTGFLVGYLLRKKFTEYQFKEAETLGQKILEEAEREAENLKKEAEVEIKEHRITLRSSLEKEREAFKSKLQGQEDAMRRRESELNRMLESNQAAEKSFKEQAQKAAAATRDLDSKKTEFNQLIAEQISKLETISNYTAAEAKEAIKTQVVEEARLEAAKTIKRLEEKTHETADADARRIISSAIQRLASDHVAESTVAVVELPNDDIKGRIIGREGRNIRALEQCTGVDLIIDDTPGAVVLSGFDPIRREIARRALESLTMDGRIHPTRIEEVVNKSKKEVEQDIIKAGEQAIMDVGLDKVAPDMVKLLGRLRYRTSYTQNVLEHSKEVAWVCGAMAGELGLDVKMAKRAGLLHDIGKAIDRHTDGTHTQLGVDIAKRYKEHKYVINAIAAHHEDVESESLYAVLVAAGDTISASRPGARREMLESYVQRMTQLEEIGDSYKGVEKTYAIQAGREIRIIVLPDALSDDEAAVMARDISKRIEKEVTYPGEIKITVVRESRYTSIAR